MRIAITIVKGTDRISPLFEAAEHAVIVDCCRARLSAETALALPEGLHAKLDVLCQAGVDSLFCGAIANESATQVQQRGLQLFSFAAGAWRDVLDGWRARRRFQPCHLMPGCSEQHRRCRHQSQRRQS